MIIERIELLREDLIEMASSMWSKSSPDEIVWALKKLNHSYTIGLNGKPITISASDVIWKKEEDSYLIFIMVESRLFLSFGEDGENLELMFTVGLEEIRNYKLGMII